MQPFKKRHCTKRCVATSFSDTEKKRGACKKRRHRLQTALQSVCGAKHKASALTKSTMFCPVQSKALYSAFAPEIYNACKANDKNWDKIENTGGIT